jgi:phosphotriesterase-related protein
MKQAGCATLVDGSPRGLNRDAELLLDAANQAGVRVIASTGVFMGRFMPADLRDMSLDDVTALWTREITRGIDGTKLRAGIVKLSINAGPLVPLEEKFIRAAARTSLKTGVPIECHLTYAPKLVDIVRVLEVEKLPLNRFVWIHADAAGDVEAAAVAARQGMWVEVDSTWQVSESGRVDFLKRLLDAGVSDRVLLSQDYTAFRRQDGKGDGRFVDLFGRFKPLAMEAGVDEATWNKITVDNPRGVFAGD